VASALWDLRVSAGATRADALLLKALPYCPPAPDFGCLFDALWMADIDYFNFEDALNILHAGLDRGIRCIPVVSITGSAVVNVGVQNTWTASMQCPARPTGFTWSLRHYCGGAPCEDWQEVGWDPEFVDTENSPGSLELKVVSLDDGGRTDTETKMVSVYYPMSVSIGGDNSIQACVVGTWCVSVIGHGPFTYQWRHNDSVVNGATSSCYSTSDIHNFTVACTVTDADGQQITRTKPVTVTGVCPPDIVAEVTEVQTAPSGGLKLAIVSGPGGLARISLFDVAGRRAVPDWNGVLKPGRQTLTLGEGQAHKGVYFYRVEMGSQTKRGTVVLLH
jgi:hypothetical protein